jgi:hypothetical protein
MKNKGLKSLFAVAFIALSMTAMAGSLTPEPESPRSNKATSSSNYSYQTSAAPKVTSEFGLGIGARHNWFAFVPMSTDFTPTISARMSYGAAMQFRLNIGRSFGIQPEISYARTVLQIDDKTNNFSEKAKSNIVQIPMLLSFRAAMFRFNFGPVFTLMDDTKYPLANTEDASIQQMSLGRLFPAVTYAAGISVKFAKVLMLDVRYADQFGRWGDMKATNAYIWTLDESKQAKAQEFRTRCRSVQVRFGCLF